MSAPVRLVKTLRHGRADDPPRRSRLLASLIVVGAVLGGCGGGPGSPPGVGDTPLRAQVLALAPVGGPVPPIRIDLPPTPTPVPVPTLVPRPTSGRSPNPETAPTPATGEKLRFVFLADSRGGGPTGLGQPVNTTSLVPIIAAIGKLDPAPDFVVFGGDMSYRGYIYTKEYPTGYTFQAWKDLFDPLADAGIPLYTAIGNHELYRHDDVAPEDGFSLANQQAFQQAFSDNPANGPAGYEHLTYSFTSPGGDSLFVVLDPYFLTADVVPDGLGGDIDPTQLAWLKGQVAQSRATHRFLFIHTPYYYVSDDPEEPSAANASYTQLWSFLDASDFDFYACGHSHLYSRRTIDASVLPNPQTTPPTAPWQNDVVQLLNGTSGAGPDTATIDPTIQSSWNVHNDAQTYYFSVVDVDGPLVSVNSYSGYTGAYTVFDSFTIDKSR